MGTLHIHTQQSSKTTVPAQWQLMRQLQQNGCGHCHFVRLHWLLFCAMTGCNGSSFRTGLILPHALPHSQAMLRGVALVSHMSAAALRIFRICLSLGAPSWTTSLWREVFQRQMHGHMRYYHTLWLYRTCPSHRHEEGQCQCHASVVDLPEC